MSFYNIYFYNNQSGGYDSKIFNSELDALQMKEQKINYIETILKDIIKNHKSIDIFILIPFIDNLYNKSISLAINKQLWNDFLSIYSQYIVISDNSLATTQESNVTSALTNPIEISIQKQLGISIIPILSSIILNKNIIFNFNNKYIELKIFSKYNNNVLFNLLKGINNATIEQNIEYWLDLLNIS